MNMKKEIQGIVEIGSKPIVERKASATGLLHLKSETKQAVIDKTVKKGDVIEASTIAAIQAVKETPRIIPHCHPIPLEGCKVDWEWEGTSLRCTVHVSAHYKTGIEMEALTGVSAGLLCVLDMIKSYEKDDDGQYPDASITDLKILEKRKG
ncbi:MAG: Cyclic pyranopterin monophosphate synthase 2 [Euryarchaeota archaeon UBA443]|nr:MAG: Cyclic pyranopterin monophosphate synthase 2 [Euryarchaeota archaeon UBA443]|tara:strand:+ start:952 stop:1404 length:453 start_codon:yes stop_codon:yes gene_type:complete